MHLLNLHQTLHLTLANSPTLQQHHQVTQPARINQRLIQYKLEQYPTLSKLAIANQAMVSQGTPLMGLQQDIQPKVLVSLIIHRAKQPS